MSKRLTILLLMLLGVVLLLAQTTRSEIKLVATKVEFNGQVKLAWTKAHNRDNTTQYNLYRAIYPDTIDVLINTGTDTTFVDQVPPIMSPLPQTFVYKVIAKTGTVFESSNSIFVPVPGIPPIGSFRIEGKIDSDKVHLLWQKPPVDIPVDYYLVYRALAFGILAPSLENADLIDSTQSQHSVTNVPSVPPGEKLVFAFFVRAKLSNGQYLLSTFLNLTVENKIPRDGIKFISIPSLTAEKNVPYLYTAKAISIDENAVIRYYGKAWMNNQLPVESGFKIDSASGIVDWIPMSKGHYSVNIVAKSNKGGSANQNFVVSVAGGNGIIQGKIIDTLNAGIPNVIVEIYKTENTSFVSFAYVAKTDPNGNYRINHIDPGSYKLRANAPSTKYQSQWFEGKRDVSQADIVTVIDSPAVSIANFKLRSGIFNGPKFAISGSVTDTSGIAINDANCRVVFVRAEFALNFGGGMNFDIENIRKYFDFNQHGDFRLEGNSEFVFKAAVDSLGHYRVDVPPGGYIAFARAKRYAIQFFNGESNLLSADIIHVLQNMDNINFTLSPLPAVVLGAITGSVLDSVRNIAIPSRVIAFRDGWRFNDRHRIAKIYLTDTDSTGSYVMDDLLPGKYVVMALPLGNYAPAFYSNDTLNMRWMHATKIEVNGNSIDDINIYVKSFSASANGYTSISGRISFGNGNGMMSGSNKAGALVYAYSRGEIAGYSITNPEGDYTITGLAPGEYSVFVDKTGYNESNTMNVNASYDPSGNPIGGTVNFTINAVLSAVANTTVQPTDYILEQNYPNPFNPTTTISYSLPQSGIVALKVYNLIGQEITTLVNGYNDAGHYAVSFKASDLASGIYFYRLESGSFKVVKKMLLMK